jgi:hypothetical protein
MSKYEQETPKIPIKNFLNSLLQSFGFKRGADYQIFTDHLFIIKNPKRGKALSVLKEFYPEYNFYWENPKILMWF